MFYVLANTFAQLSKSGPLPSEAKLWNPSIALPSEMRDAIALFERELARQTSRAMTVKSSRFVGMMEHDLESLYDLLPFLFKVLGEFVLIKIENGSYTFGEQFLPKPNITSYKFQAFHVHCLLLC